MANQLAFLQDVIQDMKDNNLYGIVTKAGADAIPETLVQTLIREGKPISGDRWMTLVLVGERVGSVFERGVTQFPTAEDEVHLVTLDDLQPLKAPKHIRSFHLITVYQGVMAPLIPGKRSQDTPIV